MTRVKPLQMLFVTGAPRSGTTFVSDWITQAEDAYCAHEISREVDGMTDSEILDYPLALRPYWHRPPGQACPARVRPLARAPAAGAEDTATWPGFTADEHATLWVSSLLLWQRYRERGYPTLTVRWERLLLEYGTVRDELRDFLGLALPVFHGYERSETIRCCRFLL